MLSGAPKYRAAYRLLSAACRLLLLWLKTHSGGAGKELAVADGEDPDAQLRTGGFELAVGGGGSSGRVLGSRQLARYYRQSYRPSDSRRSVAIASVLAQCAIAGLLGFHYI